MKFPDLSSYDPRSINLSAAWNSTVATGNAIIPKILSTSKKIQADITVPHIITPARENLPESFFENANVIAVGAALKEYVPLVSSFAAGITLASGVFETGCLNIRAAVKSTTGFVLTALTTVALADENNIDNLIKAFSLGILLSTVASISTCCSARRIAKI